MSACPSKTFNCITNSASGAGGKEESCCAIPNIAQQKKKIEITNAFIFENDLLVYSNYIAKLQKKHEYIGGS